MRSIWMLFLLVAALKPVSAQMADSGSADSSLFIAYIPRYSWSAGIGWASVPNSITENTWLPDHVVVSGWISERVYMNAGLFARTDGDEKYVGLYGGFSMKLYLFRNAYFIPSLNLYGDFFNLGDEGRYNALSLGPAVSFEYFIGNRFSLGTDLMDVGFGWKFESGGSAGFYLSNHQLLGLRAGYHFDL